MFALFFSLFARPGIVAHVASSSSSSSSLVLSRLRRRGVASSLAGLRVRPSVRSFVRSLPPSLPLSLTHCSPSARRSGVRSLACSHSKTRSSPRSRPHRHRLLPFLKSLMILPVFEVSLARRLARISRPSGSERPSRRTRRPSVSPPYAAPSWRCSWTRVPAARTEREGAAPISRKNEEEKKAANGNESG